ncbi:WD40-repeat-containing domain protein [Tribonema minus]|uniref:Ribosome biogenesis protein WDR12 homolog n=1 Tax=Tribonema minus TaxID=303371 RepID=A0A836CE58_9STRA|nr:WD40-repeat-containing domain protein [Tribonema minus]
MNASSCWQLHTAHAFLSRASLPHCATPPQVRVKFVTKLASIRVTDLPIAVPETLGRYGLSEVVNHLLGLNADTSAAAAAPHDAAPPSSKAPIPFDILIDGRFLRTSLARYMRAHAVSGETVLELEYLPALRQPTEESADTQPDWVSALAACAGAAGTGGERVAGPFLASACYDGCLRLYGASGGLDIAHSARVSAQPLTALAAAAGGGAGGGDDAERCWLLAGGKDRGVSLWRVSGGEQRMLEQAAVLSGHQNSVAAVSFSPAGGTHTAASGDWDGRMCLWDLAAAQGAAGADAEAGGPGVKRRKRAAGEADAVVVELEPTAVFKAHSQAVTGVYLAGPDTLYTGSWDHSLKAWDAQRQDCVRTMACAKAVACMDAQGGDDAAAASGLLATGHPDGRIRVWDVRTKAGETLTLATLAARGGWVYGVKWAHGSAYNLASSSRDGSVRLWDIRSGAALRTLPAHKGAALCVAWHAGGVASGGDDGVVRTFKVEVAATVT